jgi:hypothetical protein
MKWTIEYYNQNVQDWVGKMPIGIRAAYAKLTGLLAEFGMDLRLPHSRAMGYLSYAQKERKELLAFFIARWWVNELWFYTQRIRHCYTADERGEK